MKTKVFVTLGLAAMLSACQDHDNLYNADYANAQKQLTYETTFESVFGAIDPNQDWNLFTTANVQVDVNEDWGETYTVYVYTANPLNESEEALLLASGEVKSGQTSFAQTIVVPKGQAQLFVALANKKNQVDVKAVGISNASAQVTFGAESGTRAGTTFVTIEKGTTAYSENKVAEMLESAIEFDENSTSSETLANQVYMISSNKTIQDQFNGDSDNNSLAGTSIIITNGATAKLSSTIMSGITVIVQNGTLQLGTGANLGMAEEVVVLPGGTLKIVDNSNDITLCKLFNAGTIDITGSAFFNETYNIGTITINGNLTDSSWEGGKKLVNNGHLTVSGKYTAKGGKFYNSCYAKFGSAYMTGLDLGDGAQLEVTGEATIGNDFRLGVSSVLYIGELVDNRYYDGGTLQAPPTVTSSDENAEIKIGKVTGWNYNNSAWLGHYTIDCGGYGDALGTYDNQYSTLGKCKIAILGYKYDEYQADTEGQYATISSFKLPTAPAVDACRTELDKEIITLTTVKSYAYYAFEDMGSIGDYDFNDVVIRVYQKDDNSQAKVQLVAAGGTLHVAVKYGSTVLWDDVHGSGAFNDASVVNVGTSTFNSNYPTAYITISDSSKDYNNLTDLTIEVTNESGTSQTLASTVITSGSVTGKAPQCLIIPASWKWPMEYVSVRDVYPNFSGWVQSQNVNTNWYTSVREGWENKVITPTK